MKEIEDLDIAVLQNDVIRPNGAELVSMMQARELEADFWTLKYDEEVFPDIAQDIDIYEYGRFLPSDKPFSTTFNTISPALTSPSFLEAYDVVICHQDLTEILAYRAKKRYDVKMIWYMHNVSDLLYLQQLSQSQGRKEDISLPISLISKILGIYLKPLDRKAFEAADRIFANSKRTMKQIIEPIFGRSEKLKPLYPPIRKIGGASKSKEYVLVISRVARYKNLEQVLKEMEGRNEKIRFAGKIDDEVYKKEIEDRAKSNDLEVEFLGFVEEERLGELISEAKFGIYPSDNENFGLVPLEMIKAGTPCFVRSGIGATEVLPDEYELPIEEIPDLDDLDLNLNEKHFQTLRDEIRELVRDHKG
ncbi:MAG: glycosyltransferase family 4 protein [Halobacteriaceae archaeon]